VEHGHEVRARAQQNMLEHELISLISEANENLLFGLNLVKHKSSGVVMNTT
jgi:hypothetical protein